MKDTTTERKLQLLRQIRSRYNEDSYDMRDRERLLYGRESVRPREEDWNDPEGELPPSTFRLRFLAAVLLFAAVIAIDANKTSFFGITAEKVYQVIAVDYEDKIEEWVKTLSPSK